MKLVVTTECRFNRTPDGNVWSHTMFPHTFWTRYLEVFDYISVVARVLDVHSVPSDWKRVNGEGVSCYAIPYYIGPWQYFQKMRQVQHAAISAVGSEDAVIFRLGSRIAKEIQPMLLKNGHPYGVEIVSDPFDAFAPGAIEHPLRLFFRIHGLFNLKQQCAKACAAAYVTKHTLQRRYPPSVNAFSTYYSDVELPDTAFAETARQIDREIKSFTLVHVGSMAQMYKGQDILMDAVELCLREGLDLRLVLIGDGKYRPKIENHAAKLDLRGRVSFPGQLPAGDAIRHQLDLANLFVFPSKTEGLPRALIEAMARGLPCIGSSVGGIPELLIPEDMVPPGDATALAGKIQEVVTDPERMARMSGRNLEKAKQYKNEMLHERRIEFYRYVRDQTEAWLVSQREKP